MSELNTTPAPTPETDKATVTTDWMTGKPVVPADFARRLERERDEARDELLLCYGAERDYQRDQLRARVTTLEQRILDDNKAFGCELRDPNGTIWEHADKLQKENADLRQSLENHAQANDKLVVEVADLRRDREDLDWLEKHFHEVRRQDPGPTMDCEPVRFSVWTPEHGRTNRFTDLRSAVRAARAKDAKTEGQPYDAKAHNSLQP